MSSSHSLVPRLSPLAYKYLIWQGLWVQRSSITILMYGLEPWNEATYMYLMGGEVQVCIYAV